MAKKISSDNVKIQKKYLVATPTPKEMDFWVKSGLNVLFVGKHGVGKNSMVEACFKKNNLRYKYFSAATMDPFVDFIGVPKEQVDEKGPYLDLVKPKDFRDDEVDAIFFDELNRSHPKVRNAVMELIQFKSINGKKYPNLKIIWAAINPKAENDEDSNYDVEQLDEAQEDRFPIKIELPYKPNANYFESMYGKEKANAAIDWWNKIPTAMQNLISPRRLQYALDHAIRGGKLSHILPPYAGISELEDVISNGTPESQLIEVIKGTKEEIANWMKVPNNFNKVKDIICNKKYIAAFDCVEPEDIANAMMNNSNVFDYAMSKYDTDNKFKEVIESTVKSGGSTNTLPVEILEKVYTSSKGVASHSFMLNYTRSIMKNFKRESIVSGGRAITTIPWINIDGKFKKLPATRQRVVDYISGDISCKLKTAADPSLFVPAIGSPVLSKNGDVYSFMKAVDSLYMSSMDDFCKELIRNDAEFYSIKDKRALYFLLNHFEYSLKAGLSAQNEIQCIARVVPSICGVLGMTKQDLCSLCPFIVSKTEYYATRVKKDFLLGKMIKMSERKYYKLFEYVA